MPCRALPYLLWSIVRNKVTCADMKYWYFIMMVLSFGKKIVASVFLWLFGYSSVQIGFPVIFFTCYFSQSTLIQFIFRKMQHNNLFVVVLFCYYTCCLDFLMFCLQMIWSSNLRVPLSLVKKFGVLCVGWKHSVNWSTRTVMVRY